MRRIHVVALAAAILFGILGIDLVASALLGAADRWANDVVALWSDDTRDVFDFIADVIVYVVAPALCVVAIAQTIRARNLAHGAAIALLLLAMAANNTILKPAFERVRPPTAWSETFAFPSGHTTAALLVAATFLVPGITPLRLGLVGFLSLVAGLARVLGGAHWVSDILGSFAYGICVAALVLGNKRVEAPASSSA